MIKKELEKIIERIWKVACINKWGNKCGACGSKVVSCIHHFFPRSSSKYLKWSVENGVPICVSCHVGIHKRNDPRIVENIIDRRGRGWYNKLKKEKEKGEKLGSFYNKEFLENEIDKLKKWL